MEEVTINITEEVEEITINVFEGGTEQIQSDFDQTNETAVDFIKNKPTIDDTVTEASQNAVKSSGIWTWAKGLFTPKDPTETEADTLTDESVFQFWKGELKKITWANIKAALRTYFDTIYSTFSGSYNDLSHKPTIPSNAAQITVSDPVTPDFTPAVQGDNLQQVANKVAGAQLKTLVDYTLTSPQHTIEFTKDDSGKSLTIYKSIIILVDIIGFQDEIGDAQNSRMAIRFNDIVTGYDWGAQTNSNMIQINGSATSFQKGMVLLQINSNGYIGFSVSNAHSYSLINKQVVEPIVKVFFSTGSAARLASIGSRIVILGQ